MWPLILGGAALGGIVSGVGSYAAAKAQAKANQSMNDRNIDFQRETNAQNEALMRESWLRDDTAVQRRRADLEAAGLSPLLAAGSSAGNTGPVSMTAPQQSTPQISGSAAKYVALTHGLQAGLSTAQSLMQQKATLEKLDILKNEQLSKASERTRQTAQEWHFPNAKPGTIFWNSNTDQPLAMTKPQWETWAKIHKVDIDIKNLALNQSRTASQNASSAAQIRLIDATIKKIYWDIKYWWKNAAAGVAGSVLKGVLKK